MFYIVILMLNIYYPNVTETLSTAKLKIQKAKRFCSCEEALDRKYSTILLDLNSCHTCQQLLTLLQFKRVKDF